VFIYIYFAATFSALAGHLQAEYTIIFGKLHHYNGSVVYSSRRWPARAETCSGEINIDKHLLKLLRGMVLPITLIKYAQQDADPQNKKLLVPLCLSTRDAVNSRVADMTNFGMVRPC
jgi:hypothetical protein